MREMDYSGQPTLNQLLIGVNSADHVASPSYRQEIANMM